MTALERINQIKEAYEDRLQQQNEIIRSTVDTVTGLTEIEQKDLIESSRNQWISFCSKQWWI